jgi:hypothetical protein
MRTKRISDRGFDENMSDYICENLGRGTVHYLENGTVWISRGLSLYKGSEEGNNFSLVGSVPEKRFWRRWLSKTRLGSRVIRGGILDFCPLPDGTLVATSRGTVYVQRPGEEAFSQTLHRPGRRWRLESLPDGTLFAGEYFSNEGRGKVEILVSYDSGWTWESAYLFPAGAIRHIHGICYDHIRDKLIVLTGDENYEAMVIATSDRFKTTELLMKGSQAARALTIIPYGDGYWLGTDTPFEQNYAQFISPQGKIISRIPLSGSCLSSSGTGMHVFFGTAAEPSAVNLDPAAKLYAYDGSFWSVFGSWRADKWSGTGRRRAALFQMARVILPKCRGETHTMFATTVAVRETDGQLHRWIL